MSIKRQIDFDPSDTAIIKEIYDTENAHDAFVEELERALEGGYGVIVVEPSRLGDETARWISVGNCLHKTAVLTGLAALTTGLTWPDYPWSYTPLGVTSLFCTGLYTVSWQFDPCVKYQVLTEAEMLFKLPLFSCLTSASPVVLFRKDDTRRKALHCSVTLLSSLICAWRLYKLFNSN